MLGLILSLAMAGLGIWVYRDATEHGIGKIPGKKDFFSMPAGVWGAVIAFAPYFGILMAMLYFNKRNELIMQAKEHPVMVEPHQRSVVFKLMMGATVVSLLYSKMHSGHATSPVLRHENAAHKDRSNR